jgi:superfamily II DNA or RNA helicase
MKATAHLMTWILSTLLTLSLSSTAQARGPVCEDVFSRALTPARVAVAPQVKPQAKPQTTAKPAAGESAPSAPRASAQQPGRTRAEQALGQRKPKLASDDQLLAEIDALKTSQPELSEQVKLARDAKKRHHSLRLDLHELPTHMTYFLQGAYEKVLGDRGLSKPFVTVKALGENQLVITQAGDHFPLLVRWTEDTVTPQRARLVNVEGVNYQTLDLPLAFKTQKDLRQLPEKFIFSLIAGSSLNRYIPSASSPIARMTSLLHDGQLVFDRPTQAESKQVSVLLQTQAPLRKKVRSLLFVAPTASGKTRVLGDAIVNKLKNATPDRKLTILMTKTPDLTSELSLSIGDQVVTELGGRNVRIVQWGGELSQDLSLPQLIKFIDASPVPVLLISSYPTIAARAKASGDKAQLFERANGLMIDEAHNATGATFEDVMRVAKAQADKDRQGSKLDSALDILGVTASPVTREQRTLDVFDRTFWAGVDSPNRWAKSIVAGTAPEPGHSVLDWVRVLKQYAIARDRGEIAAADPLFYKPEERGFDFSTIFKRGDGTASSVNIERLKQIYPDVANMIQGQGPGVIHTYPRDAEPVAKALSELSGKNFVSLQKLNPSQRFDVYRAFRDQTPYNGRNVDGIVGQIREGLDFPKAGWYLSFKKYVRFPENIQGPGRVVRLALNKPSPVIVFFGEEINKIAYEGVRDLVMSKLGALPRKLNEPRYYSGSRRGDVLAPTTAAIEDVNIALQALLRIRKDLTKELGGKDDLNPQKVGELQNVIRDIRLSGSKNREIDQALTKLVNELYAFPFFNGKLNTTFSWCDRVIAQAKKGKSDLSSQELEQVKAFRALYAQIGSLPRALLIDMELKPLNVTEVAQAVNAYVARNGEAPLKGEGPNSLKTLVDMAAASSPAGLWRSLSNEARAKLSNVISSESQVDLERSLQIYIGAYGHLPKAQYEILRQNEVTAADRMGAKMMEELETKLTDGTLEVERLSKDLQQALDASPTFEDAALGALQASMKLKEETSNVYAAGLKADGLLTYENLKLSGEFKVLKVVEKLASSLGRDSKAHDFKTSIEEALAKSNGDI